MISYCISNCCVVGTLRDFLEGEGLGEGLLFTFDVFELDVLRVFINPLLLVL